MATSARPCTDVPKRTVFVVVALDAGSATAVPATRRAMATVTVAAPLRNLSTRHILPFPGNLLQLLQRSALRQPVCRRPAIVSDPHGSISAVSAGSGASVQQLSAAQARRIAVAAQGLASPRPAAVGMRQVTGVVDRI